ncbi:HNH endonuclease signature motif containing protein [Pseudonocardia aurantiaca]|uniref:DUF222 domain-containing protein n=1 Tax=Pseudonocardia aurantiaca TaxID=75290 RepID=A0ABW4FHY4_9PSEU
MFETVTPSLAGDELADLDLLTWPEPPPDRTWADTAPSGIAALELDVDTADPACLSDAQLIDAMVGFERQAAWAQARQARIVAEFARRRPPDAKDMAGTDRTCAASPYAPDEVGLALRLSRWSATARIGQSRELVERLPETLGLWQAGRLDERRVTAICDATRNLPVDTARAVQERVLPRAPEQTLGQLKAALARAVIAADPESAERRHTAARRDRRVAVNPEPEGMASLWALLPATDAVAAFGWLTRLARGCGAQDPRSMDARRADLLAALLTGRLTPATAAAPGGSEGPRPVSPGKPLVQVVMPFTTLLGADQQPCELVGHGPITAEHAREIASDATLVRLVYDPRSGTLLDYGRATDRPPAGLADHVRARDVHCRQPICRRRATDSELDHLIPFPLGPTSEANLATGCSHDHHLKHSPGWQVHALPDGVIEWITPTGHRYRSTPHDYRDDDDPFPQVWAARPPPDQPTPQHHDPADDPPPF